MLSERGSTRQWRILRQQVLERDCYLCQVRGPGCTTVATTVDHRQPRAMNGSDAPTNLRAACAMCNARRNKTRNQIAAQVSHQSRW